MNLSKWKALAVSASGGLLVVPVLFDKNVASGCWAALGAVTIFAVVWAATWDAMPLAWRVRSLCIAGPIALLVVASLLTVVIGPLVHEAVTPEHLATAGLEESALLGGGSIGLVWAFGKKRRA